MTYYRGNGSFELKFDDVEQERQVPYIGVTFIKEDFINILVDHTYKWKNAPEYDYNYRDTIYCERWGNISFEPYSSYLSYKPAGDNMYLVYFDETKQPYYGI